MILTQTGLGTYLEARLKYLLMDCCEVAKGSQACQCMPVAQHLRGIELGRYSPALGRSGVEGHPSI